MAHQFGNRLREVRSEWGLLQRELEELLTLRPGSVSQYERGLREPGFDLLLSIADELDVTVDYLLGRECALLDSTKLAARRAALREELGKVAAPPAEPNARLALLLTCAEKVDARLFSLPKLARRLTVAESTMKSCRAGAGGLSAGARERLARYLGVDSFWAGCA